MQTPMKYRAVSARTTLSMPVISCGGMRLTSIRGKTRMPAVLLAEGQANLEVHQFTGRSNSGINHR